MKKNYNSIPLPPTGAWISITEMNPDALLPAHASPTTNPNNVLPLVISVFI